MEKTTDRLIGMEWQMFDEVRHIEGRADCQDDFETFDIMRRSQFEAWSEELRERYLLDLKRAEEEGRNLLSEKYAYMTQYNAPGEYEKLRGLLPSLSEEKMGIIRRLADEHLVLYARLREEFPLVLSKGRKEYTAQELPYEASIETYLLGEMSTYSLQTLETYRLWMETLCARGENIVYKTFENTLRHYGFGSLEEAERLFAGFLKKD
ncbi:MAG: DUF4125 family protein [Clostridiales Family XIII bacterium]|jgi:hypothetical protein|nr:DUF4125 family protein [Clostridiales Family XIII bacterium]